MKSLLDLWFVETTSTWTPELGRYCDSVVGVGLIVDELTPTQGAFRRLYVCSIVPENSKDCGFFVTRGEEDFTNELRLYDTRNGALAWADQLRERFAAEATAVGGAPE